MIVLESDFATIVSLLITPNKRKKWDLKLIDMEELPTNTDDKKLRFFYGQDRSVFEFHNQVRVQQTLSTTFLHFKSKKFSNTETKGVLGEVNSSYKLEYLTRHDSSFISSNNHNGLKRSASCDELLTENREKIQASVKCT